VSERDIGLRRHCHEIRLGACHIHHHDGYSHLRPARFRHHLHQHERGDPWTGLERTPETVLGNGRAAHYRCSAIMSGYSQDGGHCGSDSCGEG
jgi:hypothetical protein